MATYNSLTSGPKFRGGGHLPSLSDASYGPDSLQYVAESLVHRLPYGKNQEK